MRALRLSSHSSDEPGGDCPPMTGDFVILQDNFSAYVGLELEREKAAGKELILDSPKAYFASYFVFLNQSQS